MAQSRSKRQASRTPGRNYPLEYKNYQGTPKQLKNRAERNSARREYEKANGNLPATMDVNHIKPLSKGGSNRPANLNIQLRSHNRSFRRTRKAGMK